MKKEYIIVTHKIELGKNYYFIKMRKDGRNWQEVTEMEDKEVAEKELSRLQEEEKKRVVKNRRVRVNRKAIDSVMSSLGLTKVKGSVSGKTYWE
jgi:hypothetical protein